VTHPDPGDLVDLARQLPVAGNEERARAHLQDCVPCRRAFERLTLLVEAARRSARPPEDAVRRAEGLVAREEDPAPAILRARLVFDNLLQPLPAGIRGGAPHRHLMYEADHWTIDLQIVFGERKIDITGQLAHALGPTRPCVGVAALARSARAIVARDVTGPWGEFTLDCGDLAPAQLEILVAAPAITIELPPLGR
jgi:hypothetical protein